MLHVSVFQNGNAVLEIEEKGDREITIGRSPGCVIRLDEPNVSRLHAVIFHQTGQWVIEKKSSFGQLQVNGQEVENAILQGGEEIAIASFTLRTNTEGTGSVSVADPLSMAGDGAEAAEAASAPAAGATGGTGAGTGENEFSDNGDDDGATKILQAPAQAILRFEPGVASVGTYNIEKDITLIGRGSNCDVILLEKKASRKHLEIRRQGLTFFIKDLQSGNGTLVNGERIDQTELVPGDVIQIGESKFQFTVENQDLIDGQAQLPSDLLNLDTDEPSDQFFPPAIPEGGQAAAFAQEQQYDEHGNPIGPGAGAADEEPEDPNDKSLINKWRRKFRKLDKQTQTRIAIVAVIIMMIFAFSPDEEPVKKKGPSRASCAKKMRLECLDQARQRMIKKTYGQLIEANEKKEYSKMLILANTIGQVFPDYLDTQQLKRAAEKGIEREEKRKRDEEERKRREALMAEVRKLEARGEKLYAQAVKDKSARPKLAALIQEIFTQQPTNMKAANWRDSIKQVEERERLAEIEKRKAEALKRRAESAFDRVRDMWKVDGKYYETVAEAEKLKQIPYEENNYIERIEQLKKDVMADLDSRTAPLLEEARKFREVEKDLVKAKNKYREVLAIDRKNTAASLGLNEIRETLFIETKRLYVEAILAEDMSSIDLAEKKFRECVRTAPEPLKGTTDYKKRCQNKLKKYEGFP